MKQLISLTLVSLTIACGKPSIEEEDFAIQPAPQPAIETTTKTATATTTTSTTTTTVATTTTEIATTATEVDGFNTDQTYTNIIANIWVNDNMDYNAESIIAAYNYIQNSNEWGQAVKDATTNAIQIFETVGGVTHGGGWAPYNNGNPYAEYNGTGDGYGTNGEVENYGMENAVRNIVYIMTHELTHVVNHVFTEEQMARQDELYVELVPLAAELGLIDEALVPLVLDAHNGNFVNVPGDIYHHGFINDFEALVYMSQVYVSAIEGAIYSTSELDNQLLDMMPELEAFMIETGIIQ